jgi:hypothetical protein
MDVQPTTPLPPTETTDSPACCESTLLEVCCAPERKAECCGHAVPESCQCDARNRAESRIAT